MSFSPAEQEKPHIPLPESYDEVMKIPVFEKAKKTILTLLQKGKLSIHPGFYRNDQDSEKPAELKLDQIELSPVVGVEIPVLVVTPRNTKIQIHPNSTFKKIFIHLPQDASDTDTCYVLDTGKQRISPLLTTIGYMNTGYGIQGYCVPASGEDLGYPTIRHIWKDEYLSAIVLFASCWAEAVNFPNNQITALKIPSNF